MELSKKSVTVRLTKANYNNAIEFKRWEILVMKNFGFSSGKRYSIITADTEVKNESATLSLYGLNISRWWLIRKIQMSVLRNVFKKNL